MSAEKSAADIKALIEQSSLGAPEAKALRATVSDEQAARIVARARELACLHDSGCDGRSHSLPCNNAWYGS